MPAYSPMPPRLETERLVLRPWVAADTSWHRPLVTERGEGEPTAEHDAATVARVIGTGLRTGLAPYVVERDGRPIGYCGLVVGRSTADEPELAYELFRAGHNRGYATEAARAVVAAVGRTGRARIWATIRPWNAPSLRVAEKLGFVADRTTTDERGDIVWNRLDLP